MCEAESENKCDGTVFRLFDLTGVTAVTAMIMREAGNEVGDKECGGERAGELEIWS